KHAIRGSRRPACANYWKKLAENTSPSCTRTKYVARIFGDFSALHHRDHRGVRVSWTSKHRAATGGVPRHGAPDESARANAARFVRGRAGTTLAGSWHSSDWVRNAEAPER